MSSPPTTESRRNPWTHVLVACCTVFIVTVFLMVAAAFNRQAVGLARFFDRHGMLILGVEVVAILALAVVVMAVERRETRRQIEERERALLEERPMGGTGGSPASGSAHSASWGQRPLADEPAAPDADFSVRGRSGFGTGGPKSACGGPVAPEGEPLVPPGEELP
jgi:uncharacterized integral membrane protein